MGLDYGRVVQGPNYIGGVLQGALTLSLTKGLSGHGVLMLTEGGTGGKQIVFLIQPAGCCNLSRYVQGKIWQVAATWHVKRSVISRDCRLFKRSKKKRYFAVEL